MIARIRVGNTLAWTKGDVWHCSVAGIAGILNSQASAAIVQSETSNYIPDISAAMAQYAAQHIPQVTLVSISKPRKDRKDAEGRAPVYDQKSN